MEYIKDPKHPAVPKELYQVVALAYGDAPALVFTASLDRWDFSYDAPITRAAIQLRYVHEEQSLDSIWVNEFAPKGHCCLCGNAGVLDTRGNVFTPAGKECGAHVFCICPNGRTMKAHHDG